MTDRPYGCRDHAPYRDTVVVQDGWVDVPLTDRQMSRMPKLVTIQVPMSKHCQYSIDTVDPRCEGCCWHRKEPADEDR